MGQLLRIRWNQILRGTLMMVVVFSFIIIQIISVFFLDCTPRRWWRCGWWRWWWFNQNIIISIVYVCDWIWWCLLKIKSIFILNSSSPCPMSMQKLAHVWRYIDVIFAPHFGGLHKLLIELMIETCMKSVKIIHSQSSKK